MFSRFLQSSKRKTNVFAVQHSRKQKTPSIRVFLALLNLSLAGIQDKALLHCSRAIFLAQLEKVPVPNKFTLCRLAACCSNFGGRLTQDLDWNRLRGLFVLLATRSCESQIWLPVCVKKTPQLGPKMAPKLGFQFEAPTWVALYVHTGNPKSRARFRCPELSCFWNPFEFNNN